MIWISKWKSEKEIRKEKHTNIVTCLFPYPPRWPSYNTFKESKRNYKSCSQLGIYDMSFIFSQELELCYKLLHLVFDLHRVIFCMEYRQEFFFFFFERNDRG